jgi:hypothetical protein
MARNPTIRCHLLTTNRSFRRPGRASRKRKSHLGIGPGHAGFCEPSQSQPKREGSRDTREGTGQKSNALWWYKRTHHPPSWSKRNPKPPPGLPYGPRPTAPSAPPFAFLVPRYGLSCLLLASSASVSKRCRRRSGQPKASFVAKTAAAATYLPSLEHTHNRHAGETTRTQLDTQAMGLHMDAQVGTQVDAQMDAWVRHMAGQPALPHPNPTSSQLLVRVSKIPRCTVPHPAFVALARQVHQHPQHPHAYARDAVVGPGCEISESSQQGGRQIQERCTTGWPALAAPQSLQSLPMY